MYVFRGTDVKVTTSRREKGYVVYRNAYFLKTCSSRKSRTKQILMSDFYKGMALIDQLDGAKSRFVAWEKGDIDIGKTVSSLEPILGKGLEKRVLSYNDNPVFLTDDIYPCVSFFELPFFEVDLAAIWHIFEYASSDESVVEFWSKVPFEEDKSKLIPCYCNDSKLMDMRMLRSLLGSGTVYLLARAAASREFLGFNTFVLLGDNRPLNITGNDADDSESGIKGFTINCFFPYLWNAVWCDDETFQPRPESFYESRNKNPFNSLEERKKKAHPELYHPNTVFLVRCPRFLCHGAEIWNLTKDVSFGLGLGKTKLGFVSFERTYLDFAAFFNFNTVSKEETRV